LFVAPTRRQKAGTASLASSKALQLAIVAVISLTFLLLVPFAFGDRPELQSARKMIAWYTNWIHLGVAHSLSLTNNTWQSHLGPFIARVTSSAYVCKTTAFDKTGLQGIVCPKGSKELIAGDVNVFQIFAKVIPDAMAWGFGSALAELVPYMLAVAFVASLKLSQGDISKRILAYLQRARASLGPLEATVLASIPNPAIETTGLVCGLFSLPMMSCLRAVFLGKILIRGSLLVHYHLIAFN